MIAGLRRSRLLQFSAGAVAALLVAVTCTAQPTTPTPSGASDEFASFAPKK